MSEKHFLRDQLKLSDRHGRGNTRSSAPNTPPLLRVSETGEHLL